MSPSETANIISSHEHSEMYSYSGNKFYDAIHELVILNGFNQGLDVAM